MTKNIDFSVLNLIQHVELNKIGWWDYVVQRLILATIWMEGKQVPESASIIDELIRKNFDLSLGEKLDKEINNLIISGDLIKTVNGSIKLSESTQKAVNNDLSEAENIIIRAKDVFLKNIAEIVKDHTKHEEIWESFNNIFLRPFIKSIGANIYSFLLGDFENIDQSLLDEFTKIFPEEMKSAIQSKSIGFLKSKDPNVRSYILRTLNACFCIEASGLEKNTLEAIQDSLIKPKELIFFIDTNFIFSLLELHENPSNSAATGLLKLIKNLNGTINIRLYVSMQTLNETKTALSNIIDSLDGTRLTPNVAEVASRLVSGLSQKYFNDIRNSKISISPKEYFQPYIDNLVLFLKKIGVEIYNEENSNLNTRQDVVDDILDQSKFEEKKWGERAKTYKTLEHDIVLWHFVLDKRIVGVDSPLDAKYWIVTIDYRFLGFDEYKKSLGTTNVPICIHPSTLIQLLQFWVPRSELLEETLYSSLWLPFIFRDLDPQSENVTIEIVKVLSRFTNIGDLPEESVMEILVNNALRQKIKNEPDIAKQINLVREVLIEQNIKIQNRVNMITEEKNSYLKEIEEKDKKINSLQAELTNVIENLDVEKAKGEEREGKLEEIQEYIRVNDEKRIIQWFLIKAISIPFILLGILWALFLAEIKSLWAIGYALSGIILVISIVIINYQGKKDEVISKTNLFKKFNKFIKLIVGILNLIILTIIADVISEYVRNVSLFSIFGIIKK